MNNQQIVYWLKQIVGFLILNKDLLKAYLNNYEGTTPKELISKLARNFVAQNFAKLLGDYIARRIDKKLSSAKSLLSVKWHNVMSLFQAKGLPL